METAVILAIIEMAAKYGIPAVIDAVNAWGLDSIKESDLAHLEALVAKPESYFKTKVGE